jgi:hypothetical protein
MSAKKQIKPIFPQIFASGLFIDSFSPNTEKEISSIIKAIKSFKVDLVVVLDNKRLEHSIRREIEEWNNLNK